MNSEQPYKIFQAPSIGTQFTVSLSPILATLPPSLHPLVPARGLALQVTQAHATALCEQLALLAGYLPRLYIS